MCRCGMKLKRCASKLIIPHACFHVLHAHASSNSGQYQTIDPSQLHACRAQLKLLRQAMMSEGAEAACMLSFNAQYAQTLDPPGNAHPLQTLALSAWVHPCAIMGHTMTYSVGSCRPRYVAYQ